MGISVIQLCMLAVVVSLGPCGCSGAEGLVGLWKTKTVRVTVPGRTNIVESYQTVEFLKDGAFKIGASVITDGDKRTQGLFSGIYFSGTYALIDTNHVRLEVAPNQARPSDKVPLTRRFSIVGSELEVENLISDVPETQKYRRVKR